jgi:hypothetical protein
MGTLLLAMLLAAVPLQAPAQNANGSIEGLILRAGTNTPVVGVFISVRAPTDGTTASVESDANGRFVINDLPPGRYFVRGEREGYLIRNGPGGRAPIVEAVTLLPNQRLRLPTFTLTPVSTIAGRVRDAENRPIAKLTVDVLRFSSDERGSVWQRVGITTTDDRGEYRASDLSPGEYYLRTGQRSSDATRTYYPGTPDALSAAPIRLGEGSEVVADIKLSPVDPAVAHKISGKITLDIPDLAFFPSTVLSLVPRNRTGPREDGLQVFIVASLAEGSTGGFEILGVRRGVYDLVANARGPSATYLAKVPIEVRDRDVRDIEIVLRPGFEVSGRITVDGAAQGIRVRPGSLGQSLTSAGGVGGGSGFGGTLPPNELSIRLSRKDNFGGLFERGPLVNPIGTEFSFPNVPAGDYEISVGGAISPTRSDIYLADIRQGVQSVLYSGFTVAPDSPPLEIVIGSNGGRLEGTIEGKSANGAQLVLVPQGARRQNRELYISLPLTATNATGRFTLRGIAPGEYKLFAWELAAGQLPELPYGDPEFLARYETRGTVVSVQKGTTIGGIKVRMIPAGQ